MTPTEASKKIYNAEREGTALTKTDPSHSAASMLTRQQKGKRTLLKVGIKK